MYQQLGTTHAGANNLSLNKFRRPRNARRRKDRGMNRGLDVLVANREERAAAESEHRFRTAKPLPKRSKDIVKDRREARLQAIADGTIIKHNPLAEPVNEDLDDMARRLANSWGL